MYGPTPPVPPSAQPTPAYPPPGPYAGYAGYPGHGYPPFMPTPTPTPPRSTAARVGLFVLRAVLTCLPVVTFGLLACVPLMRTAAVRRRPWDWVAVVGVAVLSFTGFAVVGSARNDESGQAAVGMSILFLLVVASPVYFLVTELRKPPLPKPPPYLAPWRAAAPPPPAAPITPLTPIVPLGQVQAELDELSALLRGHHERPTA